MNHGTGNDPQSVGRGHIFRGSGPPPGAFQRDDPPSFGIVEIYRPDGCDRTDLSLNALDSHSRELARHTFIAVNGRLISCTAIAVKDGNLILTVAAGGYKFIEDDDDIRRSA